MEGLFLFSEAKRYDPAIDAWMLDHSVELQEISKQWFGVLRACGNDIRELIHDGHPTACVGPVAFAYVSTFTAHVNVGFFRGAELDDPHGLLVGSGRRMRHVKIQPGREHDQQALKQLIEIAYQDMKNRIGV